MINRAWQAQKIKEKMERLLAELIEYGKHKKAEIVYRKCLRAGKYNLAKRIRIKYNLPEPYDDMTVAFGFTLKQRENDTN